MSNDVKEQDEPGLPLLSASEPGSPRECCGGACGSAEGNVQFAASAPVLPALEYIPITDADGRRLGPDDWEWWHKHLGYQAPRPEQIPVYEENRRRFLDLGEYVHGTLPPGEDRAHALRQLGAVLMAVNNTIAAHGVGVAVGAAAED